MLIKSCTSSCSRWYSSSLRPRRSCVSSPSTAEIFCFAHASKCSPWCWRRDANTSEVSNSFSNRSCAEIRFPLESARFRMSRYILWTSGSAVRILATIGCPRKAVPPVMNRTFPRKKSAIDIISFSCYHRTDAGRTRQARSHVRRWKPRLPWKMMHLRPPESFLTVIRQDMLRIRFLQEF